MKYEISESDHDLIKRKYGLDESEILEAEKLYYRTSMSPLAAARTIANRRPNNDE